jgi:hypothetical protein
MKRVSDKYYIHMYVPGDERGENWFMEMDGQRVLEKEYPELDLFVYQLSSNNGDEYYIVSDGKSGAVITPSKSDSRDISIELARQLLEKVGTERTNMTIERMIKKHGLSPRYDV